MTIDQLREQKKEILERKANALALQDLGQGDEMELFLIEEELLEINALIREMEPRYRVGRNRVTHNSFAADRQQYTEWAQQESEDNSGERAAMYQAIAQVDEVLTEAQKKAFALWRTGMTMEAIGKELGINKATVSRSLARAKTRIRESVEITGELTDREGRALLDVSDPNTSTVILACVTPKQAVCMYLYYGEGLSLRKIEALVGVDKTAVMRLIHRGLANISKALGYQHVEIENLEVLGDLAYSLYFEGFEPPEEIGTLKRGPDWGRVALGENPRRPEYWKVKEYPITVTAEKNKPLEPGKLLRMLRERANASWIYRCLYALFTKIKSAARRKERVRQGKEEK